MKELCLTAKKRKSSLLLILAYVNHLKHWSNFWCYLADYFQFLSHLHSTCVYSGPNLHILGRSGREESMKITKQWKWGKKTAGSQLIQVKSMNQGNNYDKTKAFYPSQKAEFLIFAQYSFHLCIPHCLLLSWRNKSKAKGPWCPLHPVLQELFSVWGAGETQNRAD